MVDPQTQTELQPYLLPGERIAWTGRPRAGLRFGAFGRFFVDTWLRGGTRYALTGRRALVMRKVLGAQITSSPLDGQVRLSRQRGDRGSLEFGALNPFRVFSGGGWVPGLASGVAFEDVPDVMQAYALATPAR